MAQATDALKRQLDLYAGPSLAMMLKERSGYNKQTKKVELIAGLLQIIGDEDGTRAAFESLNGQQKMLLRVLREQGGSSTVSALKVAANAAGLSHFDGNLHELMRRALVLFTTPGNVRHELWRADDGRYSSWDLNAQYGVAGVPLALELADDAIELPRLAHVVAAYDEEPFSTAEQSPTALLHALWSIVRWATEREVTLTKTTGTLRKADLKALEAQLKEAVYLQDFALSLAFEAGLLRQKRERIEATTEAPAFFARAPREQIEKLLNAWRDLPNWSEFFRIPEIQTADAIVPRADAYSWGYDRTDVPNNEALPAARAYLLGVLKRAGRETLGQWQGLVSLRDVIKTENAEFLIPRKSQRSYYGSAQSSGVYLGFWPQGESRWNTFFSRDDDWHRVEGRFLRQMLCEPLLWLGVVAIARDAGDEVVAFRLTPLGAHLLGLADELPADESAEKPLIVQPNFEILAYTEAGHLPVLYQLERFALRERAERVAHYKIDKESVYRGLQDGLSAAEMREFLETHSRSGVPQNIAYSLGDWEALWQSIAIAPSATIIEADTSDEMDALLAALPDGAATRLAPQWAKIEPGYEPQARNFLASHQARAFDYSIETEQAFAIDKNLELSVPLGSLDLWLRSKLEQFADELPASTTSAKFRVTRESVARGLELGLQADDLLAFLEQTGTPPIPANVALTLRGWGGAIKPLALGSMQVLVAPPETIEQMAAIEELKPLLWLGLEGAVLIKSGDVAKLKAGLKKRGIGFDGRAESHLKAPKPAKPIATPKRAKPAHKGVEIGAVGEVGKTQVDVMSAHPDESEVELESNLSERATENRLQLAMDESRCVVIEYQSKVRRALRKISPLEIFEEGDNIYVGAYDHWRRADRMFRIDRILRIAVLDERFDAAQFE